MIEDIRNIKSEKSDLRNFGITLGIILLIVCGLLFWNEKESFQIFLIAGIILSFTAVARPSFLRPFYRIWMVFAIILGWIMTRLILIFLFYVIITSIGLTSRLFGKQFLELRCDKSKESYWNFRTNRHLKKLNYERQF